MTFATSPLEAVDVRTISNTLGTIWAASTDVGCACTLNNVVVMAKSRMSEVFVFIRFLFISYRKNVSINQCINVGFLLYKVLLHTSREYISMN